MLAQVYARELKQGHIGAEHLLLALLADGDEIPAQVLASFGVDQGTVRVRLIEAVGLGEQPSGPPGQQIPFTPRAKKALELALREALALGHNDIRTGHLLLGLVRDEEGLGVSLLLGLDVELQALRDRVRERLGPPSAGEGVRVPGGMRGSSEASVSGNVTSVGSEDPLCPSCSQPLSETLRVKTIDAVLEGQGSSQSVEVTYCGACGSALSAGRQRQTPGLLRVPDPRDPQSVEGRFQERCRELIDQIQTAGFTPGGWIGLITRHGAVGAARELLSTGQILPVTRWLLEQGQPELTMEREITRQEWATIFDDAERAEAERRLERAAEDD